jgi:hypothetical protein
MGTRGAKTKGNDRHRALAQDVKGARSENMTTRNVAAQLRARAKAVRQRAAAEPVELLRKALLNDADLWERMAAYEEKASEGARAEHPPRRTPASPEPA